MRNRTKYALATALCASLVTVSSFAFGDFGVNAAKAPEMCELTATGYAADSYGLSFKTSNGICNVRVNKDAYDMAVLLSESGEEALYTFETRPATKAENESLIAYENEYADEIATYEIAENVVAYTETGVRIGSTESDAGNFVTDFYESLRNASEIAPVDKEISLSSLNENEWYRIAGTGTGVSITSENSKPGVLRIINLNGDFTKGCAPVLTNYEKTNVNTFDVAGSYYVKFVPYESNEIALKKSAANVTFFTSENSGGGTLFSTEYICNNTKSVKTLIYDDTEIELGADDAVRLPAEVCYFTIRNNGWF